jgi:hypothetical protein
LPVLVFQLPPLSHCATLSQTEAGAASAFPASAIGCSDGNGACDGQP